jgi:hypothetical protein
VLGILLAAIALFFTGLELLPLIIIGLLLVAYLWVIYAATSRVADVEQVETVDV